jgi:hypothetical protein
MDDNSITTKPLRRGINVHEERENRLNNDSKTKLVYSVIFTFVVTSILMAFLSYFKYKREWIARLAKAGINYDSENDYFILKDTRISPSNTNSKFPPYPNYLNRPKKTTPDKTALGIEKPPTTTTLPTRFVKQMRGSLRDLKVGETGFASESVIKVENESKKMWVETIYRYDPEYNEWRHIQFERKENGFDVTILEQNVGDTNFEMKKRNYFFEDQKLKEDYLPVISLEIRKKDVN